MHRLDEISFADLSPLGDFLKSHLGKNRYIHFSKGVFDEKLNKTVKKVGINTKKHHLDPPGVYFYPVDWLWNHEDFHDNQQFAVNWPFYYISEIDFSRPGIDLSTITDAEIEELGARNGWLDEYHAYNPNYQLRGGNPQKMWEVLKTLNQRSDANARKTWLQSLRGMAWIKDRNGIILSHEPEQVCVVDPRAMRLVESGEQPMIHSHEWETWKYWQRPFTTVLKTLEQSHGGRIVWHSKKPTYEVTGPDWHFTVSWVDGGWGGIRWAQRTGRATDSDTISTNKLKNLSIDEIIAKIEEKLALCQTFDGDDLLFKPVASPAEIEQIISSYVSRSKAPTWEIMNAHKFLRAECTNTSGVPPCFSNFAVGADEKEIWIMATIKVNNQLVASIGKIRPKDFEEKFMLALDTYCPGKPGSGHSREFEPEEWEPFLGWMFIHTGFKIFEKYQEKFTRYRNIHELYGQIQWVFSRVGW
jgi:hypothetical protein